MSPARAVEGRGLPAANAAGDAYDESATRPSSPEDFLPIAYTLAIARSRCEAVTDAARPGYASLGESHA
jgi:hypothetical protein